MTRFSQPPDSFGNPGLPSHETATPTVLVVGPWSSGEFATTLRQLAGSVEWPAAATVTAAIETVAACQTPPEIALIAVARPNDCHDAELYELQQAAPLMRLVVVAGSWCEGELRTGQPPRGFLRLYWHELPSWWNAAMQTVQRGGTPPWSATLPDHFAGPLFAETTPQLDSPRRLIVDAGDHLVHETIESIFTPLGWAVEWQPRRRPDRWTEYRDGLPTAGLFDGSQLDPKESDQLSAFCKRMAAAGASVVTLLDYPRREHQQKIRALGATALLGKPYRVEALAALLAEAAQQQ